MPEPDTGLLPETIRCPYCNARMDLYQEERIVKKFECPACNRVIDFSNTPSQLTGVLARMGKKANPSKE
jgi:uncharacterized protein with PIN domain